MFIDLETMAKSPPVKKKKQSSLQFVSKGNSSSQQASHSLGTVCNKWANHDHQ